MIHRPLLDIKDEAVRKALQHIHENTLGNVISLDSAPTTAEGELKDNQLGKYGNKLYITIGGTTYSLSLTEV